MTKKINQNKEVYKEMMRTGKSLLQLYTELKDNEVKNITDSSFDLKDEIMNENSIKNIELVISSFLRERGMILTAETQEELLVALADSTPQPNTNQEWTEFGQHWLDGGWEDMQWYDTSEGAVDDAQWYDFTEDDCFYPYDEHLVIRFKI